MPDNPIWDALEEVLGYEPKAHEYKLWGKLSKDFKLAGATPDTIRRAAYGYRQMFPNVEMTPTALLKHYSAALARREHVHKPRRTVAADHDALVKGVPLAAIQAAARGDWERAKELGS